MTYRERMHRAYDRIASEYAAWNAAMPAEVAVWVEELLRAAGFKVLEKQRNPAGLRTWLLFLAALQH